MTHIATAKHQAQSPARLSGREKYRRNFTQRLKAVELSSETLNHAALFAKVYIAKSGIWKPFTDGKKNRMFQVQVPGGVYAGEELMIEIGERGYFVSCPDIDMTDSSRKFVIDFDERL